MQSLQTTSFERHALITSLSMSTSEYVKTKSYVGNHKARQPDYMSKPLSDRHALTSKLTKTNMKYFRKGVEFREQYIKCRQLTRDEEIIAGKFSNVGRRLDAVRDQLRKDLDREPSNQEWADACSLSHTQLDTYYGLAIQARRRLVAHNFRLVDFWSRRLIEHTTAGKDVSYYELTTEGIIGLSKAAERYDGSTKFINFAQVYVRHELYRGMTHLRPGSFLNHNTVMLKFRANRARERLNEIHNRDPTDEEVAAELNMKPSTMKAELHTAALKNTIISGNSNTGNSDKGSGGHGGESNMDGDDRTFFDLFQNADTTSYASDSLQWKIDFQRALSECLSPIEKRTLCLRYGIFDGKRISVDRTAELMCVSTESVRKILLRSFSKLKESPFAVLLEDGPPLRSEARSGTDTTGRTVTRGSY